MSEPAAYLDALGRRVEVQSIASGSGRWAAWVRLRDGVNWKPWNVKRIRPSRDRAAVQKALDVLAAARNLRQVCPACNGARLAGNPRTAPPVPCARCGAAGWNPNPNGGTP